jgi:hypothetical protein
MAKTATATPAATTPAEIAPAPKPGRYRDDDVITVLVDNNPKKEGSKSRERFKLYGPKGATITVSDFLKAAGPVGRGDLPWDSDPRRKFISITRGGSPVA